MSEKIVRIRDLSCPHKALSAARDIAGEVVSLGVHEYGTKGAAIDQLSRTHGFGSWLRKLHRGDKVTIHVHFYFSLLNAMDEMIARQEARLAHDRAILATMRGEDARSREDLAADGLAVAALHNVA